MALTKAIETCPCYSSANKRILEFIKDKQNKNEWTEEAKEQTKKILTNICECYSQGKKAMEDYIKKSEGLIPSILHKKQETQEKQKVNHKKSLEERREELNIKNKL